MLYEKVDLLMNTLYVRSVDIARLTNHSPTAFSRLRSGSRAPKRDSPTIQRFVEGILLFAAETDQMKKLGTLIHCESAKTWNSAITEWLYSDSIPKRMNDQKDCMGKFSKRLNMLMELAGMNNRMLASASNIEYSYISRLHRGERFPKSVSYSLQQICDVIFCKITKDGKLEELSEQTDIPAENLNTLTLRDWLSGFDDNIDIISARKLIGKIEKMKPEPQESLALPVYFDLVIAEYYLGDRGLQDAVTRFLSNIQTGNEIWLYSDHPTNWMTDSFQSKWRALMLRCVQMRVNIRIIHNIERNTSEMLAAIQNWLPLYMSGSIESFYSTKQNGERFHHTLFLCPGNAAITGCSPDEDNCEYSYVTDPDRLHRLEAAFSSLLKNSKPLYSKYAESQQMDDPVLSGRFGNAEVFANKHAVIVNKLSAPCFSLRLFHPNIIKTFTALLNQNTSLRV